MIKIEWLISGSAPEWIEENYSNGGYVYDTYARKSLRELFPLHVTYLNRGMSNNKFQRTLQIAEYARQARSLNLTGDVVVRDLYSTIFVPFDPKRKHVVLMHHLDTSVSKRKFIYWLLKKRFLKNVVKAAAVVVVSEYWRDFLEAAGCENVRVIYNPFDMSFFESIETGLERFREKYGFPADKPIVYLGNSSDEKGVLEAYEALKDLDVHFVSTGKRKLELPINQLFLPYREYLKLLAVSTIVITMSKFKEGWCRVAHEAMLCGTPVIGSGTGGMMELLDNGGQVLCENINELSTITKNLLNDESERMQRARTGYNYAKMFSMDDFKKNWQDLINRTLESN